MNTPSSTKPFGQPATNVADQSLTGSGGGSMQGSGSTQGAGSLQSGSGTGASQGMGSSMTDKADASLDSLSGAAKQVREQAEPVLNRMSEQAEAAARRGIDAVRDGSHQLREKAQQATDSTVAYVKDEPVKSMLIAAATGAVLMALVTMMGRSRH